MKTFIKVLFAAMVAVGASSANAQDMENDFRNPPMQYRPYVWWHWMGSNFSLTGITKDLEAMKEAGIGGATIFNISSAVQESQAPTLNNPWPDQTYRSAAYWRAVEFACSEAQRLGLEMGLHNSGGLFHHWRSVD
jgi:opacity protein-like surface antigen